MTRSPNALSLLPAGALLLAAVAGALALSPTAGSAQLLRPLHLSAGAGVALPVSGSPPLRTGYQVQVGGELDVPGSPVAFRLQAMFDRFRGKYGLALPCPFPGCASTPPPHERLIAGTLDLLVALSPPSGPLTPYFVVGAGVFNHELDYSGSGSPGDDLGEDVGLAIRIPHVDFEMTTHFVPHASDFMPISVSVRF